MKNSAWEDVREGDNYLFGLLRIDIVNSTTIARANNTEATEDTLADFFEGVQKAVLGHGGRRWSRDGDGGLFAFYAATHSATAGCAAKAAIDIVDDLANFNRLKNRLNAPLRVRVALHLGWIRFSADAGSIASDDINFVTKLEKNHTFPDSISISDAVFKELDSELRSRFREFSSFQDHKVWSPGVRRTGEAYVFLEVEPGASNDVASRLAVMDAVAVRYAAAVWGPWDVVARVAMNKFDDLLTFIDSLRNEINHVRRTETWCVRNDQPHFEAEASSDNLAFVMLRIDPAFASPESVLADLCRSAEQDGIRVRHVGGVLGPYDIAATVHYDDDEALRSLVMEKFQRNRAVRHTLTIPSIRGMVYPKV